MSDSALCLLALGMILLATNLKCSSTVSTTNLTTPVNITPSKTSVNSKTPNASVSSTTANASVSSKTPSASVSSTTPSASVSSTTPSASVSRTTSNASVSSKTPSASVSSTTPNASVSRTTSNASVSSTTPNASVSSKTPNASVSSTTPNASVSSTTPNASVSSKTPSASVSSTTPSASVSRTTPKTPASSKTPNEPVQIGINRSRGHFDIPCSLKFNKNFSDDMNNKTSPVYKNITLALTEAFDKMSGFMYVRIKELRKGSVICDFENAFRATISVHETVNAVKTSLRHSLISTSSTYHLNLDDEYLNSSLKNFSSEVEDTVSDTCKAVDVCETGYKCDWTQHKCISQCSHYKCDNSGKCLLTAQGQPMCRCVDTNKYVYSGEHCDVVTERLKMTSTYIIVIAAGAGGGLIFMLVVALVCVCCQRKKKQKKHKQDDQKNRTDIRVSGRTPPDRTLTHYGKDGATDTSVHDSFMLEPLGRNDRYSMLGPQGRNDGYSMLGPQGRNDGYSMQGPQGINDFSVRWEKNWSADDSKVNIVRSPKSDDEHMMKPWNARHQFSRTNGVYGDTTERDVTMNLRHQDARETFPIDTRSGPAVIYPTLQSELRRPRDYHDYRTDPVSHTGRVTDGYSREVEGQGGRLRDNYVLEGERKFGYEGGHAGHKYSAEKDRHFESENERRWQSKENQSGARFGAPNRENEERTPAMYQHRLPETRFQIRRPQLSFNQH